MSSWVKWAAGGTLALVVVLGWGTVRSWAAYARAATQEAIEEAIPIDVQLGRLDTDVAGTETAIREGVKHVATAAFERDEAIERQDQLRDRRKGLLRDIEALSEHLKQSPSRQKFIYEGREFSRLAVEGDLRQKVEKVTVLDEHLKSQHQIVEIRSAGVASEERNLAALAGRRSKLEIQAETLRAEYEQLKSLDQAGKAGVDTSRLAEAEKLAQGIKRKLGISRKMLESGQLCDENGIRPVVVPERSATELADDLLAREGGTR